jgi:hypothetical protein
MIKKIKKSAFISLISKIRVPIQSSWASHKKSVSIRLIRKIRVPIQSQRIFSVTIVITASITCTIQNRTEIVTSWYPCFW